jgi:prophage regulatory protein
MIFFLVCSAIFTKLLIDLPASKKIRGRIKMDKKLSILRRKQVQRRTGLPRSSMYLMMSEGLFPKPVKLGSRSVGWFEHEVEAWLAKRLKDRDGTLQPV